MTDNDIFEKYKLVPHYVIKRTSLNNYRKKIKEYLSVSVEENNTHRLCTFKCKDDNALSHFEHFIYKWTVHNGKNTMIISKLVNKKLVPLKKKIVDNGTPDDCGDYNLAIRGLELNGYKLIYSIK